MIADERWISHVNLRSCSKWLDHGGSYCKTGDFTNRFFIIEAILGKSCQILVIYLTKFIRKIRGFISFLVLFITFRA